MAHRNHTNQREPEKVGRQHYFDKCKVCGRRDDLILDQTCAQCLEGKKFEEPIRQANSL